MNSITNRNRRRTNINSITLPQIQTKKELPVLKTELTTRNLEHHRSSTNSSLHSSVESPNNSSEMIALNTTISRLPSDDLDTEIPAESNLMLDSESKFFNNRGVARRNEVISKISIHSTLANQTNKTLESNISNNKSSSSDGITALPNLLNRKRRQSSFNRLSAVQRMKKKNVDKRKLKSIDDMRRQVVDYFISQLYLAADLCLDRNYVSIGILEKRLSYSVLVSMIKHPMLSPAIKAPVCRIIRCLYIDKDPQVITRFPRLIRTSVSLGGGDELNSMSAPHSFALVQQLISDYIRSDLNTTRCDELSSEMIDLLESLILFGFYRTPLQLQDILIPLIQVTSFFAF